MDEARVRAGVQDRLDRLSVARVDLLQLHWWAWEHLAYVDLARGVAAQAAEGRIAHVGMTNTATDHLHLLRSLGLRIATYLVSFSLLDRRAAGRMTENCMQTGTRLVCYGSLCGGKRGARHLGHSELMVKKTCKRA